MSQLKVHDAALESFERTRRQARMSFVLILADGLGWKDLGLFGSDLYQTPNISKLARDWLLTSAAARHSQ